MSTTEIPPPERGVEGEVTCDYCGEPISESDQDLMIDNMHEGCYDDCLGDLAAEEGKPK